MTTIEAVVFDLDHSSGQVTLNGQPGLRSMAVSPDGQWVASGTWRQTNVVIWDARTGNRLKDLRADGSSEVGFSPNGRSLAFVQRTAGRSFLWVVPRLAPDASAARRVFSGVGSFTDLEWSPDGRWLLVGWRDADQWVFIRSARVRKIEAVSGIRSQFDSTRFPSVSGWCCG